MTFLIIRLSWQSHVCNVNLCLELKLNCTNAEMAENFNLNFVCAIQITCQTFYWNHQLLVNGFSHARFMPSISCYFHKNNSKFHFVRKKGNFTNENNFNFDQRINLLNFQTVFPAAMAFTGASLVANRTLTECESWTQIHVGIK